MGFESTRPQAIPTWLQDPTGEAYQAGVGAVEDDTLLGLKEAAKIRWPLEGCIDPSDDAALEAQAQNRQISRAPGEAGLGFRGRLANAFDLAYWRGTRSAYFNVFEPYWPEAHTPCTAELIRDAEGLPFLAQTPSSSDWIQVYGNHDVGGYWDGNSEWFSRVFVHVDSHTEDGPFTTDGLWDDPGVWDDGRLWDCNISELDAKYIRYEIRRTKALPAYPVTIAFWLHDITNGLQFPLDGFWFSSGNWDDPGVWDDEVTQDPVFMTIGNVWHQEAGLGGWLGLASPQLYDMWTTDEMPGQSWEGFVPP
jgi:hypothetical protein